MIISLTIQINRAAANTLADDELNLGIFLKVDRCASRLEQKRRQKL